MYKKCKSEQSSARQRKLENGLLEIMQLHHYNDISVNDICAHMQIPRKSFYRYFSNKDGALYALLDHTLEDCSRNIDQQHTIEQAIGKFFSFWDDHKMLLDALERSNLSVKLLDRACEFAMLEHGLVNRLMQRFPFFEKKAVVIFLSTGLINIVLDWHKNNTQTHIDKMVKTVTTLLIEPLFLPEE